MPNLNTSSRRMFLQHAAGLGLVSASMPVLTRWAAAQDDIVTVTWGNYHAPELHPIYFKKYGRSPKLSLQVNVEETFQKLRTGFSADTAHPDSYAVGRWRDADLLQPIDTGKLKYWPDVIDELKVIPGTVTGGDQWFVPCTWSSTSVIYRSDLVDPAYQDNPTWNILWDEKYKGRIAIADSMDEVLVSVALVMGADDPFNMSDDELKEAQKLLRTQRDNALFYWTSRADVEQALVSGEVVAALGWSPSYVELKQAGAPVAYMNPVEGRLNLVDGLVWLKNGEGAADMVYDYLDGWLQPESGKYAIEKFGHGHANRRAYDLVSEEKLKELDLTDPVASLDDGLFLQEIPGKKREEYNILFENVKAGF